MPLFLGAGVGLAAPAAAIDDATHPDARVTQGPSCHPGGLVIEVVAGTLAYSVRLTTTRNAGAEDEALLQPGQAVELRTGGVAPGETIDARLEFAAEDGSGTTFADDLDDYTLTRPTAEDCDAATAPPASPTPEPLPEPVPPPEPTDPAQPPPPSATPPTPAPSSPAPSAQPGGRATAVPAGGTVRIRVEGYRPGEQVTIALRGSGEVLVTATADDDGAVTAEVPIPARTATGPAALDVAGGNPDAVAAVPLRVAAAVSGAGAGEVSSLPVLAAAGALSAAGAALLSATGRRRGGR